MTKMLQTPEEYRRVLAYIQKRGTPVNWYSLRNVSLHDDDPTPIIKPNGVLSQLHDEGYLSEKDGRYVLSARGLALLAEEDGSDDSFEVQS